MSVVWFRRHDTQQHLHMLPYQRVSSPPMTEELYAQCKKSIHVLTKDGQVLSGGRAALFMLSQVGYPRLGYFFQHRPFIWFVEWLYWRIANHRGKLYKWFFSGRAKRKKNKK